MNGHRHIVVVCVVAVLSLAACSGSPAPPPTSVAATTAPVEPAVLTPSATPTPTWAEVFETSRTGVARVGVTFCGYRGSGTAFLVGPNTAVTAAHVVEDAASISLRLGSEVFAGTTVGVDTKNDLALLQIDGFPSGHVFDVSSDQVGTGTAIAALGYPFGEPIGITPGVITADGLTVQVTDTTSLTGAFRLDSVLSPGNSGGPVVTPDGTVVGVVDAKDETGNGYAVGRDTLVQVLDDWHGGNLAAVQPVTCERSDDGLPGRTVEMTISSGAPEASVIAQTFQDFATSINEQWIWNAWTFLGPRMRTKAVSAEKYAEGLRTSRWVSFDLLGVTVVDDLTNTVTAHLITEQAPEWGYDGQSCSDYRITYTMVLSSGDWQIDEARFTDGIPPTPCDGETYGD